MEHLVFENETVFNANKRGKNLLKKVAVVDNRVKILQKRFPMILHEKFFSSLVAEQQEIDTNAGFSHRVFHRIRNPFETPFLYPL